MFISLTDCLQRARLAEFLEQQRAREAAFMREMKKDSIEFMRAAKLNSTLNATHSFRIAMPSPSTQTAAPQTHKALSNNKKTAQLPPKAVRSTNKPTTATASCNSRIKVIDTWGDEEAEEDRILMRVDSDLREQMKRKEKLDTVL